MGPKRNRLPGRGACGLGFFCVCAARRATAGERELNAGQPCARRQPQDDAIRHTNSTFRSTTTPTLVRPPPLSRTLVYARREAPPPAARPAIIFLSPRRCVSQIVLGTLLACPTRQATPLSRGVRSGSSPATLPMHSRHASEDGEREAQVILSNTFGAIKVIVDHICITCQDMGRKSESQILSVSFGASSCCCSEEEGRSRAGVPRI